MSGGAHESVAEPMAGGETVMEKVGRAASMTPSETAIWIFEYVPVTPSTGVPLRVPVVASNVAQSGLPAILNVRLSPSGSLALGWNEYGMLVFALEAGLPEIVGAWLTGGGGGVVPGVGSAA